MSAPRRLARTVNAQLTKRLRMRVVRVHETSPHAPVSVRPPSDPRDRLVQRPVFVLSSVRSGSTLLRLILNSHSQVCAPHETHFRRLAVDPTTNPVRQAMKALDLNRHDLEHLLWDRLLHRELVRSGKSVLVEKTPSNVFVADRLATAWPDARFVFLIRHPYSIARSWHEAAPDRRSMEQSIKHTHWFMQALEKDRQRLPGLTVRYEDLTGQPEQEVRRICEFLEVDWEPAMLDYGQFDHGRLARGLGDWRAKIKTGSVQAGRDLPSDDEIPRELRATCRAWGY